METRPSWCSSAMLIWLLATGTVNSAPTPTPSPSSTTSFKTQYPPSIQGARVLGAQTAGVYHTSLEREGHPPLRQAGATHAPQNHLGLNDIFDTLTHPDSLVDWLLSGEESNEPDKPASKPESTPASTPAAAALPSSIPASTPYSTPVIKQTPSAAATPSASNTAVKPTTPVVQPSSASPVHSSQAASHNPASEVHPTTTPMAQAQDVFLPVAAGPPPRTISARNDHPVPKKWIVNSTVPIETNKFYSGLFLGTQTNTTFTHPYGVSWAKGSGNAGSWGMSISHVEADKMASGPTNAKLPNSPISFYVNPVGIQSMILSATELSSSTVLDTENPLPFSANAVLRPRNGSAESITFPVVQGMGYVTGIYSNLQPVIQSSVTYNKVVSAGSPRPGIFKYIATLEDQATWLIYVTPQDGKDPDLRLESTMSLRGPRGWSGTIQVAKNPSGTSGEKLFDNSSGVYALEGAVAGGVSQRSGSYNLLWAKAGLNAQSTPLMMFALPHHIEAFDSSTRGRATNITMRTTTKGRATAVIGETWTMIEPELPIDMGFAPWSPSVGSVDRLSTGARKAIIEAAPTELNGSVINESNLNSMYFSGKALSKYATLVYTVHKLAESPQLAASTLKDLKTAFARFVDNKQQFPLVYDNVWKGVVSSASYDGGDSGADFGNTLYNDHHFHYGYFIHAAAIIGALDPAWIEPNKEYVNMLVRDAGNSAGNDPYFPFSRGFDWFHGHSWAKGLFESFDGKDQESSSEDTMFAYSLKMWGKTSGDASMEARGNLMLGILRRTLKHYFLLEKENQNHPANFIGNKVSGILFENKVDHTTYFGANLEYIQGIHMLPILPNTAFARNQKFVREEWEAMFASSAAAPAEKIEGGWKGVLYANLAIIDPKAAWEFFTQPNFNYGWIDGGATRTWYLAFIAGLGGGPA